VCFVRPAPPAVAPPLQPDTNMPADPTPPDNPAESEQPPAVVHQFTVLRGMAVAMVIETRDWYLGLLQAALARVRLEGHN
jgi:hypothetical protein